MKLTVFGLHFDSSPVGFCIPKSSKQLKSDDRNDPVNDEERSKFTLQSGSEISQMNSERFGLLSVRCVGCWKENNTSGISFDGKSVWKVPVSERISEEVPEKPIR